MIGRLLQVVDALIAAADDRSKAILPGAQAVTAKAPGPADPLGTASLSKPPTGLFTGLDGPFPNPVRLRLTGRVEIGAAVPNPPKPSSLRVNVDFPLSGNQALTSSAGQSVAVAADGTWELSPTLHFFNQIPRYTLVGSVTVEPTTAPVRAEPIRIDNAGLDWFLDAYDREESKAGLSDRLIFLARVRKVTQTVGAFDFVIGQAKNEKALYPATSDMAARWKAALSVRVDGMPVRLDHAVAAIEGGRKQKPKLALPDWLQGMSGLVDPFIGDLLSWGGDLGSALSTFLFQRHFPAYHPGAPVYATLAEYLPELASYDQLRADLDGVVLADRYDKTRPLAANLRDYYGHDSRKRFSLFIQTEQDRLGNLAVRLKPGNPPRLTNDSKDFLANAVSVCGQMLLAGKLFLLGLRRSGAPDAGTGTGVAYPAAVDAAFELTSPEVQAAVKWFVDFLEQGLATE
jgi:hypothetical protein